MDENEAKNSKPNILRGRDVWTNRVIGWTTGALIPVLFILIPLINRAMDDAKELETLRINTSVTLSNLNARVSVLEAELENCKMRCPK